jgi:septal ring factor EnvC (AmiA/AmiB activator)
MKFLKAVFFLLLVMAAVNVHAQSSDELKRRRDKLNKELDQLNQDYQETLNNKKTSLKQLSILKAQINLRQEKIENINSEVRNLDNQISESNNNVRSLQSQLDQLKKEYGAMILFAYRNQSAYNKMMFLFASKDFNQAYKRLKYLQQFGTYRERQATYIQGTETLGNERNNQVKVVSDLSQHEGILKKQQKDLQAKIAKTNSAIKDAIRREIEEARRRAEEEERRRAEEAARLAAARAKAENKPAPVATVAPKPVARTTSSALNATPEAAKLSNDFLGNRGSLPWPVSNGITTQGFGIYTTPEGIKSESNGWDIRTNSGAAVRAVFDGTVVKVMDVSGTYLVVIVHGEYFTAYSNLRSVSVARGQKVNTKQSIGVVATDPSTGETEAHFEIYKGATPVNPKVWLAPN